MVIDVVSCSTHPFETFNLFTDRKRLQVIAPDQITSVPLILRLTNLRKRSGEMKSEAEIEKATTSFRGDPCLLSFSLYNYVARFLHEKVNLSLCWKTVRHIYSSVEVARRAQERNYNQYNQRRAERRDIIFSYSFFHTTVCGSLLETSDRFKMRLYRIQDGLPTIEHSVDGNESASKNIVVNHGNQKLKFKSGHALSYNELGYPQDDQRLEAAIESNDNISTWLSKKLMDKLIANEKDKFPLLFLYGCDAPCKHKHLIAGWVKPKLISLVESYQSEHALTVDHNRFEINGWSYDMKDVDAILAKEITHIIRKCTKLVLKTHPEYDPLTECFWAQCYQTDIRAEVVIDISSFPFLTQRTVARDDGMGIILDFQSVVQRYADEWSESALSEYQSLFADFCRLESTESWTLKQEIIWNMKQASNAHSEVARFICVVTQECHQRLAYVLLYILHTGETWETLMQTDRMMKLQCIFKGDECGVDIPDRQVVPPLWHAMLEFAYPTVDADAFKEHKYKFYRYQSPRDCQSYALSTYFWFENRTIFVHGDEAAPVIKHNTNGQLTTKWQTRKNRLSDETYIASVFNNTLFPHFKHKNSNKCESGFGRWVELIDGQNHYGDTFFCLGLNLFIINEFKTNNKYVYRHLSEIDAPWRDMVSEAVLETQRVLDDYESMEWLQRMFEEQGPFVSHRYDVNLNDKLTKITIESLVERNGIQNAKYKRIGSKLSRSLKEFVCRAYKPNTVELTDEILRSITRKRQFSLFAEHVIFAKIYYFFKSLSVC